MPEQFGFIMNFVGVYMYWNDLEFQIAWKWRFR